MGVNTPVIQSGLEYHGKFRLQAPAKLTAKLDMHEKNFKIETPPCQREVELLTARHQMFAVTRNVGQLDSEKRMQVVPKQHGPSTLEQKSGRTSAESASMMVRILNEVNMIKGTNFYLIHTDASTDLVESQNIMGKTEDLTETVDAHTACSCEALKCAV
eukprot:XP_012816966.2 PREDICTED: vitellogenin-A2-like [Xenopus tropicalis]